MSWLVESKSLKLYLSSFRNHGAFHEDCTVGIGKRLAGAGAALAAHRRLLVSARRHADRRVLADRQARGVWLPDQGVPPYRGRG
jgi:7-cyano-7-deazaguanine reductase